MTSQNGSGSNLVTGNVKQRGRKQHKARLPIFQKFSFSVGHVLNDVALEVWASYLIIFQTKVLGLSSRTAGFLWIISSSVDAVVALGVGHVCDNFNFPLLAKYHGKRKSFNLLGTILVAGLFPFIMMPCFACGEDSSEWQKVIYYGGIMIIHNVGWALSQVTHLALIPEIAKRPNEMVELHGLRSGMTFVSGIFVYTVTWILLKTDSGNESITPSQWKDFMKMSVIVAGTGCFFSLIFHLGTKEPPATEQNKTGPSDGLERQTRRTATLSLPDKTVGVFCLYDVNRLNALPAHLSLQGEVTHSEFRNDEKTMANTVPENKALENRSEDLSEKIDLEAHIKEVEETEKNVKFCFSNPGFKTEDEPVKKEEDTVVVLDKTPVIERHMKLESEPIKATFSFPNPAFVREGKQGVQSQIFQERNGLVDNPQQESLAEERQSNSSDSSGYSEGYASSPETDSVCSSEGTFTEKKTRMQQVDSDENEPTCVTSSRSLSFSCRGSSTVENDTHFNGVTIIIENVNNHNLKTSKTRKTWTDWFKTPMFYKMSFAFMCTRLVQIFTSSYAPMYLTDTLRFEKEAIAYFPLVILISGVFSSLGAKKLNKMLGAKWTYCLAASSVIGSSTWFYLQGTSGRNAAYCAAILVGCGGSLMYVTSTALAGELIGENKDSGAFVFASMSVFAKVVCGGTIFLTQEFFPSEGATSEYLRYVFSMVPGAGAIVGFFAVIAFLPATVKCRKVVHTVDSSAQTEDISNILYEIPLPQFTMADRKTGL